MGNYKHRAVITLIGSQSEQVKKMFQSMPNLEKIAFVGTKTSSTQEIKSYIVENGWKEGDVRIFNEVFDDIKYMTDFGKMLKLAYEWIISFGYKNSDILIDISGGRKWMSAVAFSFAVLKSLDLFYIAGERQTDGRIVSRDEFLGNSRKLSVVMEYDIAANDIKQCHWEAAYDRLRSIPDELSLAVVLEKAMAGVLDCIWNFRLENIGPYMDKFENVIFFNYKIEQKDKKTAEILRKQREFLENTASDLIEVKKKEELLKNKDVLERLVKLFLIIYFMSENRGDYNRCALLSYRILEVLMQHRLLNFGISPEKGSGKLKKAEIKRKFSEITKRVFKEDWSLPDRRIGLMPGLALACMLANEDEGILGQIQERIKIRNNMWLEHKFSNVNKESAEKLIGSVYEYMKRVLSKRKFKAIVGYSEGFLNNFLKTLDYIDDI